MADSVVCCFGRFEAACFRGFELDPDGSGTFFLKLVEGLISKGVVIGPFVDVLDTPTRGIFVSDIDFW